MWTGSSVKLIDDQGSIWGEYTYPEDPEPQDFLSFSPYAHPSVMIRREQLIEYGGYIPGDTPCRGEDYELFMRLYSKGARGYNLQEPYLYYRETKDSYKKRKFRFQLDEVGIRYQGFKQLGMKGPKVVPYIVKPILTAMVPAGIRVRLKQGTKQKQPAYTSRRETAYQYPPGKARTSGNMNRIRNAIDKG